MCRFFFPNSRKTSIQLVLEAQQHKKFSQTTPLDDGVSSLFMYLNGVILMDYNEKTSIWEGPYLNSIPVT
jgi:hypothetical protein